MQFLICLLVVWSGTFQAKEAMTADWPRFQDDRVSFAYPPGLHPVIAPAEELRGISGWVSQVSVAADDVRTLPVLRVNVFICDDPGLDPRVPCYDDERFSRKGCDRFEKVPVGDAVGFQCVTYSRGACSWKVVVLRVNSRVEISAPGAEYAANLKATDRVSCADGVVAGRTESPVKEMLASFQFRPRQATKKR